MKTFFRNVALLGSLALPFGTAFAARPLYGFKKVMIVMFELDGQQFVGLNGGPQFTFDEAVSVHVTCDSQEEIDELWSALTADGGEEGPCGWLKDKYGLSWQIDSRALHEMIVSPDQEAAARATKAMFTMKKLDVQALQDAFDGKS